MKLTPLQKQSRRAWQLRALAYNEVTAVSSGTTGQPIGLLLALTKAA